MKYDPIGEFLRRQTSREITLSLHDISTMIGPLPGDANTPQFWANTENHHPTRRKQWLDAGYLAYYVPATESVRFLRRSESVNDSSESVGGERWSYDELRACVTAYLELLTAQGEGLPQNKSEMRRRLLSGPLSLRSAGSYEYRMQNISAVLAELNLPFVVGYRPRKNVGPGVKGPILTLIRELWERDRELEEPTADQDTLEARVSTARSRIKAAKLQLPPPGNLTVTKVSTTIWRFQRDPNVVAWILEAASDRCEVCDAEAPFSRKDGEPYLEVHHVRPLSEGGPDTHDNAVAACPNCHRKLHFSQDRQAFRLHVIAKIDRLEDYPFRKTIEAAYESDAVEQASI